MVEPKDCSFLDYHRDIGAVRFGNTEAQVMRCKVDYSAMPVGSRRWSGENRSVVRFLSTLNKRVIALDDEDNPLASNGSAYIRKRSSCCWIVLESLLMSVDLIVVSPGVDLNQPIFQRLQARGQSICGDVELFCQVNSVPLITITGSNEDHVDHHGG